jgi:hypothetical protein
LSSRLSHAATVAGRGPDRNGRTRWGDAGDVIQLRACRAHDLLGCGLNAALAIYGDYVYVGSRTDGSSRCGPSDPRREETGIDSCPHPDPGVLIVDASDPTSPEVVGQIGPPEQGLPGQTSRELRVWPEKKLLIVMNFQCGELLHACAGSADPRLRFYDLSDPLNPAPINSYEVITREGIRRTPHEMFLWVDPKDQDRALMYVSTPNGSRNPNGVNLHVVDISDVPSGGEAYPWQRERGITSIHQRPRWDFIRCGPRTTEPGRISLTPRAFT